MSLTKEKLDEFTESIERLTLKHSESVCSKIADQFEDDLMELEGMPYGPFEFIKQLLSKSSLYRQAGVWNFLMVLNAGRHRLKKEHFDQLSEVFLNNYALYANTDLCLAVCDFIARSFPSSEAQKLLIRLRKLENQKPNSLHGFADEGLRILEREQED